MLDTGIKALAGLFGVLMLGMGLRWLVDPAGGAASIGMEVLDGLARSSQIGDLSAFFVVTGGFALLALFTRNATLLYTPAALVGGAALFRTIAWAAHGAPFAIELIGPEVVMCAAFLAARARLATPDP